MIREGRVGPAEAMVLVMTMITSRIFLSFPQVMAEAGKTAGWMVIIVSGVGALAGFAILVLLLKRFPKLGIIEIGEKVAGPLIGLAAALVYTLYFLSTFILTVREFAELILTTTLPEHPVSVVVFAGMVAAAFAAYLGLENIARTAHVLYPFFFISLAVILLMLIPFWNGDFLFPLFGSGPVTIVKTGLLKSSNFSDILFLALIMPAIGNWRKFKAIGFKAITASLTVMVTVQLVYEMVLPVPLAEDNILPGYQMARLIHFGRFFQRLEAIFIFFWLLNAMVAISASLYGATTCLAKGLKLPDYRPILYVVTLLAFSVAFLPQNYPAVLLLDRETLQNFGWIPTFILPGLLLLVAVVRKKGGQNDASLDGNLSVDRNS